MNHIEISQMDRFAEIALKELLSNEDFMSSIGYFSGKYTSEAISFHVYEIASEMMKRRESMTIALLQRGGCKHEK